MAVLLHGGHEEMDGRIFKQQPGLVDHRQMMACLTEAGAAKRKPDRAKP